MKRLITAAICLSLTGPALSASCPDVKDMTESEKDFYLLKRVKGPGTNPYSYFLMIYSRYLQTHHDKGRVLYEISEMSITYGRAISMDDIGCMYKSIYGFDVITDL